jgi:hypothetical protein
MKSPARVCKGLTFYPVPEFDNETVMIGVNEDQYFNRYDRPDIPREYQDRVQKIFFQGGTTPKVKTKEDQILVNRAFLAWLCSFTPAHEAKIDTVAYALWLYETDEEIRG